ncbi:MAG: PKD domain-containing protein [Thermoplasmata archaeon]
MRWLLLPLVVVTLLLLPPFGGLGATHRTTSTSGEAIVAGTTAHSRVTPALTAMTPALTPPLRWVNVSGASPGTRPSPSESGAMAYDPLDQESVYFGGCTAAQCPDNQTWAFSNGTWSNITNLRDAPPARWGEMMDYDPNMQGLLMFGGQSAGFAAFNDTWLFRGGVWTNLTGINPVAPTPREYATMVFDPAPEENGSVLFGGNVPGVGAANDTWIWEGWAGWVFLSTAISPPVSYNAQMAYDPVEGAIVLFGCGYGCLTANETWELYSGQWWQVSPPNPVPSYRYSAGLTYDAAISGLVLFGGLGFSGVLNDTWTFSGGTWTNVTASVGPAPPARWLAGFSPDSSAFPPVLFGGMNAADVEYNDTWVLEVPPTVALGATPTVAETSVAVAFTATMTNGTAPYHALFEFGDGDSAVAFSNTASLVVSHAYFGAGSYVPSVNATDAAGVTVSASALSGVRVGSGPTLGALSEPAGGDAGISIPFTAAGVTNGTGPFTYLWRFGDSTTAPGATASHAYAASGTYTGTLTVTDAFGVNSSRPFSEVVRPLPTVTIAAAPGIPVENNSTTFYGNVSGGTAPYRYSWNFGDGTTSSFAFPVHVFSAAGNYSVQVWVNDSVGASTYSRLAVEVAAAPGSQSPPPSGNATTSTAPAGVPSWFWPGLGALLVVGAVGAVVLLRVGRPKT